jgi:Xaa-Pro aminopeptidase
MFLTAANGATEGHRRTQDALDAMLQMARPGAGAPAMHAAALAQLGGGPLHPVLSGSVGRRIGLSLNEGAELRHGSGHALKQGEVYALHVGTPEPAGGGAIASAMIVVTASGAEILCRSSEASAPQASTPSSPAS